MKAANRTAMARLLTAMASLAALFTYADMVAYVRPSGTEGVTPTSPYGSWETAAGSIGDALAVKGVTAVYVAPGTYVPASKLSVGSGVLVESRDPETGKLDPENAVIDGSAIAGSGYTVELLGGRLVGFTVRNCGSESLENSVGAIFIVGGDSSCNALVADCIITNNVANDGGGIYMGRQNHAVISNCTFAGNIGNKGGGMYYWSEDHVYSDSLRIVDCRFIGNKGLKDWAEGPAAYVGACSFVRCTFEGFVAQYKGESSCVYPTSDVLFEDCFFLNNKDKPCLQKGAKGDSSIILKRCVFAGNYQLMLGNTPSTVLDGCVITNNPCGHLSEANPTFRNCLIAGNGINNESTVLRASLAGHVAVFDNCTIVSNIGYAVTATKGGCVLMRNSIVMRNSVRSAWNGWEAGSYLYATNCVMSLAGCKFAADDPGYTNNVVNVDPLFASAADGDFSLTKKSPCCNAGILLDWMDGDSVDIAGFPRVYGDLPDIGCYESDKRKYGFGIVVR